MKIIIQKFGGTSVSNFQRRNAAVEHIMKAKRKDFSPVIVVSAMGRAGDPYATDTLLGMVSDLGIDMPARELDLLMSCGEIISCTIMVAHLRKVGLKAKTFTGAQAGIITDDGFGGARVLSVNQKKVDEAIQNDIIPVITGFQGVTAEGEITTLGRGGSDTTAVVLGDALCATLVEIYTDVDGIMTADPRIVPTASPLRHISYSDMFQIAEQGAKVMHPRAIEIAMRSNIPIVIKNTMNDGEGTIISSSSISGAWNKTIELADAVTSITHIPHRMQVDMDNVNHNEQKRILGELAKNKISIDLINIFPNRLLFTVEERDVKTTKNILARYNYSYSIIEGCSKVSVIGNKMRGLPGIMARIIRALTNRDIKILQTADSHTTISCLVHGEDTIDAVVALHEEFKLSKR